MKKIISLSLVATLVIGACNKKNQLDMTNPFFTPWTTPYEVPPFDQIKAEHYIPAFEEGMRQQKAEIQAIIDNKEEPTFANTIEALDYSGELLGKVSSVFFNVLETNSSDSMQAIAEEISSPLSAHADEINLNADLFQRVKTVYEHQDKEQLNSEQKRLLEETYKNFVRGGANLPAEQQERFKQINQELSVLTLTFNNNVLAATNDYKLVIDNKEDLSGLPENIIQAATEEANKDKNTQGKWVFTLQNPSLIPFLQYADNRAKREEIWRAYSSRCNGGKYDNNAIITKIIKLRTERAHLLGYPSHAAYVLDDNMAKTPKAVYELLLKVWYPALEKAKQELAMYQKKAGKEPIQPWDWRYYTELIRHEQFDLNQDSLSTFFPVNKVLEGAFMVANRLYDLNFVETKELPVYDKDVVVYKVERNNEVIGILYMDFYTRSSKASGAWMTEFRGQYRTLEGENKIPVISVVYNFPNPVGDKPSLLTIDEVQTLFHEFGHSLHGLLSQCQYKSLAGTNVSRDFVELPSQVMENWSTSPEILRLYAKHYITGEVIPEAFIEKMQKVGTYGQGFDNVELIAASLLDMDYHSIEEIEDINPTEFEAACMQKYGLIDEIIPRYKSPYFKHIFTSAFGYSAGYYGYTWSAVLDADAFEAFKENGLFDKATADAFRTNILERGNTVDAMKAYVAFRGKEPDITPLLKRKGLQ